MVIILLAMDRHSRKPLTKDGRQEACRRIINLWPNMTELAKDIGAEPTTVSRWRRRGRIPAEYDLSLIDAAAHRGIQLELIELAHARWVSDQLGISA